MIIVQDKPIESRYAKALTRSQKKVTLQGASSSKPAQETSNPTTMPNKQKESTLDKFKRLTSSSSSGYSMVEQLKRTNAQISIFELLQLSSAHKEILHKALLTTNVPKDLDIDRFQSMVGHLTSSHYLTFSEEDDNSLNHPHN